MRLTIGMAGDTQIDRTLTRIANNFEDASPAFHQIATELAQMEKAQFSGQGGSGGATRWSGGAWAPLSPRYKAWKDVHFPGQPILVRTGKLRTDVTKRPFGIENITPYRMEIGTALPYAKYHQFGTPRMPMRRVMDLTTAQRQQMVKILQRFVMTGRP